MILVFFFFQAEDGIRDTSVTGVQTCALPISTWPADTSRWQDGILEAQSKKAIVSHGASVHGLPALRQVPGNKWLDIAMIRMNHKGTRMDAEDYDTHGLGDRKSVV